MLLENIHKRDVGMKAILVLACVVMSCTAHDVVEFVAPGREGHQLHGVLMQPQNPRATVVWLHGLGAHCRRTVKAMDYLADRGIASMGFDMRGHGKSSGKRSFARGMEDWIADLEDVTTYCGSVLAGPLFLVGHSAGSVIALRYAQHERAVPFKAVIATAPTLRFHPDRVAWWQQAALKMGGVLVPWVTIAQSRDAAASRLYLRDEEAIQEDMQDDLLLKELRVGTLANCLREFDVLAADAEMAVMPVHIMAAGQEYIALPAATEKHFDRMPDDQGHSMVIFPSLRHTLLRDVGKEAVWQLVVEVIDSYLQE